MHPQAALDPKLRRSLDALAALGDVSAIRSRDLSRTHRERLAAHGRLREVLKGWYVPVRPGQSGDPARAWYDDFWGFCAGYLDNRFGAAWCLAPEHAIAIHTGDWTVPEQLAVRAARGGNKPLSLPHGTTLLDLRLQPPADERVEVRGQGVRIMDLETALIASPAASYQAQPRRLHAALWLLDDVDTLATRLVEGGHSKVAGRLIGALRQIARQDLAEALTSAMKTAGVGVSVSEPFPRPPPLTGRDPSPYPNRQSLRRRWAVMRAAVLEAWPARPAAETLEPVAPDAAEAAAAVRLTASPLDPADPAALTGTSEPAVTKAAAALAAGYLELRQRLAAEAAAEHPAERFAREHRRWHRLLLTPSASIGEVAPEQVGEYRRHAHYRRASPHTPPRHEAMRDLLPVLFELLADEPDARVAAVLGHWLLTLLAPFDRGNRLLALVLSGELLAGSGFAPVLPGRSRGLEPGRFHGSSFDPMAPPDAELPSATAAGFRPAESSYGEHQAERGSAAASGDAYRLALEAAWVEDDPRALTRILAGSGR